MPPPARAPRLVINGWTVFVHPLFLAQFDSALVTAEKRGPESREAKIFSAVFKMAFEVIPLDPAHRMFFQGGTLGPTNKHWRRAKFLGGRYRLFFQFNTAQKAIVLAWVNDEDTLRTYGKKTDAYAVFEGMLGRGRPPTEWNLLLQEAMKEDNGAARIAQMLPGKS